MTRGPLVPTSEAARVIVGGGRRIGVPLSDDEPSPYADTEKLGNVIARALATNALSDSIVVSSAAAGADLLILREALAQGRRTRVYLTGDPETFKRTSVRDRGGQWVELFDRLIRQINPRDILCIGDDPYAFGELNERMVDGALALAEGKRIIGLTIWDGIEKKGSDFTADLERRLAEVGADIVRVDPRR